MVAAVSVWLAMNFVCLATVSHAVDRRTKAVAAGFLSSTVHHAVSRNHGVSSKRHSDSLIVEPE